MPLTEPQIPLVIIVVFVAATQIFAWTRDDTTSIIDKNKPTDRDIAVTAASTLDVLFAAIVTVIWIW